MADEFSYSSGTLGSSSIDSSEDWKKKVAIVLGVILILLIVIGLAYYFYGMNSPVVDQTQKVVSTNLSLEKSLVSFVITDVNFKRNQMQMLKDAASLGHKYGVTFDLAVIAKQFNEGKDNETFKVYLDNQDVFEIVSHGWNHVNLLNSSYKGEFSIIGSNMGISYAAQSEALSNSSLVFDKYGFDSAKEVLFLPGYSGDDSTLDLVRAAGYRMVVFNYSSNASLEYNYGNLIVSKSLPVSALNEWDKKNDFGKFSRDMISLVDKKQEFVILPIYPGNFDSIDKLDKSIFDVVNASNNYSKRKIVFGKITERFN